MSKNIGEGVAVVTQQTIYPVKGMGGQAIDQHRIGWHGMPADRRFAFVSSRPNPNDGLPWLSARDLPRLVAYTARSTGGNGMTDIVVYTSDGHTFPLASEELLAEISAVFGSPVALTQIYRGTFDSMDLSLISEQSVRSIGQAVGLDLDVERFRANIVVSAFAERPFPEERWIGETLVFGDRTDSARIRINRKTERCMVVNLERETGRQTHPEILREIVSNRRNRLGVYGSTEFPGTIHVGDTVRIVR